MKKSRSEAFSDGVFAIIITIMVLELKVPEDHTWAALLPLWPKFLSYLISFLYVGIYWNNHHHMFQTVRSVNGNVLWANLHQLFWLSLFPFVTAWAGESHFAAAPMTAYGIVALMCGVAYLLLVRAILGADPRNHLLTQSKESTLKENLSVAGYVIAIIAPFFGFGGAILSAALLGAVALMWVIPERRIEQVVAQADQHLDE